MSRLAYVSLFNIMRTSYHEMIDEETKKNSNLRNEWKRLCKRILLGDKDEVVKAWIIQDESRTNYMFSVHSSTKAMTTD
jgi:hypothetical protein